MKFGEAIEESEVKAFGTKIMEMGIAEGYSVAKLYAMLVVVERFIGHQLGVKNLVMQAVEESS